MQATPEGSVWLTTGPEPPSFPPLRGEAEAEVAVLGGGIVGITTALLLSEAGVDVALLEANRLVHGVTGHTTAKVTSQHGLAYARLRSRFGVEGARTYAQANEAALAWIADRIERERIECDFRRQPAYTYTRPGRGREQLEREAAAAAQAGLPASLVETTPLPYPVEAAVRFEDQAEFHPRKYLRGLVERLRERGGRIHEGSRALGVECRPPYAVRTDAGTLRAERVVLATHYPFLDRSLSFARVHAHRSYAILCRVDGDLPAGMHISGDSPVRSLRAVPVGEEELLLVGGEGHITGEGGDTERRYRSLEGFARHHWAVESVERRWSTQDNFTVDGVPYVGRATPWTDRLLMATGFAKWGMTGGTAAALLLSDLLLGRESAWAGLFDPYRLRPLAGAAKLAKESARVGRHFVGGRIAGRAVSRRCTHLGCRLAWNSAERSWDCPCHGSRFTPEGEILQGPAVRPLGPVD